MNILVYCVGL